MKYGRLPPEPVRLCDFTYYLWAPLPPAPAVVEAPDLEYAMAGNDRYGDCTIAGAVHTDQALAALTGTKWTYPGDKRVVEEYFTLTGGADTGLIETTVLKAWSSSGLFGKRLAAFAPLSVKHTHVVKQAVALCGAVYTGVLIPEPAEGQFRVGAPWALTHTSLDGDIKGGHCVPIVGYNATGPVVVTWGKLQQVTWPWWLRYAEEAYAVLTEEVKDSGELRGLNFAQLDRDLAALHAE